MLIIFLNQEYVHLTESAKISKRENKCIYSLDQLQLVALRYQLPSSTMRHLFFLILFQCLSSLEEISCFMFMMIFKNFLFQTFHSFEFGNKKGEDTI